MTYKILFIRQFPFYDIQFLCTIVLKYIVFIRDTYLLLILYLSYKILFIRHFYDIQFAFTIVLEYFYTSMYV